MILRELFYIDPDTRHQSNDLRYDADRDESTLHRKDTRKTRLTLKQINQLRKASEAHILEQEQELSFIETMYKAPAAAPA
jgi:methylphosphotriester-DNA--protein-cysteine methyltransferase